MTTNLLLDKDSFIWDDLTIDRNEMIQDFIFAYNKAKDEKNKLWNNPDIWNEPDYLHFERYLFNFEQLPPDLNWLTNDSFKGVVDFLLYYSSSTPQKSKNLPELETEFNELDNLNGIIGIDSIADNVYNLPTWYEFHCDFFTTNNEYIVWPEEKETETAENRKYLNRKDFPNLEYSNLYLIGEVIKYKESKENRKLSNLEKERIKPKEFYDLIVSHLPSEERAAVATTIGEIVANRNYFTYDEELSKAEKELVHRKDDPEIYRIKKKNRDLYLSIDFKSVTFEVCDHSGTHLGEWFFVGDNNSPPENSPPLPANKDHGIQALKRNVIRR